MSVFRIFLLPLLILGAKLSLAEYCYDAPPPEGCFVTDTDWAGHYIPSPLRGLESALHCQVACQLNAKCKVFTYIQASKQCWLKGIGAKDNAKQRSGHISGPKNCPSLPSSVKIKDSPGPYIEGNPVTLTCDITGGNPAPTIKWFRDNTEVGGETSSSYTFNVDKVDNGIDYRCEATNIVGMVASNDVNLQVHFFHETADGTKGFLLAPIGKASFAEAEAYCAGQGGILATVKNTEERDIIGSLGDELVAWIGLEYKGPNTNCRDSACDGLLVWADDTDYVFNQIPMWAVQQASNEHCFRIDPTRFPPTTIIADINCDSARQYNVVCSKEF